jgi:hypothetical protein
MKKHPKILYRVTHSGLLEQYTPIKGITELVQCSGGRWRAHSTLKHMVFEGYTTKKKAKASMVKYHEKQIASFVARLKRVKEIEV